MYAAASLVQYPRGDKKYECTMDQELADAATQAPGRRCVCSFLREMT